MVLGPSDITFATSFLFAFPCKSKAKNQGKMTKIILISDQCDILYFITSNILLKTLKAFI